MNENILAAAGTLISLLNSGFLFTIVFKAGGWMSRVDTTLASRASRDEERHTDTVTRFDRLEKKVGITNGGSAWVEKEFCKEVHRSFSREVDSIKSSNAVLATKVEEVIEEGREAIRVGHEDRMAIKARISRVEEALIK